MTIGRTCRGHVAAVVLLNRRELVALRRALLGIWLADTDRDNATLERIRAGLGVDQ